MKRRIALRCLVTSMSMMALPIATDAGAETFVARVIAVMDGDTVMVLQGHKKTRVRLAGIDAPEKLQVHGAVSRDTLAALVLNREVRVTTRAVDDYGRVVALLQAGGVDVNAEQLRRGMAWEYSRYHNNAAMVALQADAQRARRGLWAAANPQPPWDFRKSHSATRARDRAAAAASTATATSPHRACGIKHQCAQMVSCDEAKYYLVQCRIKTLDKNGDGVPCENLCGAKGR